MRDETPPARHGRGQNRCFVSPPSPRALRPLRLPPATHGWHGGRAACSTPGWPGDPGPLSGDTALSPARCTLQPGLGLSSCCPRGRGEQLRGLGGTRGFGAPLEASAQVGGGAGTETGHSFLPLAFRFQHLKIQSSRTAMQSLHSHVDTRLLRHSQ